MRSRTSSGFRRDFAALPPRVQRQARDAYRLFTIDPHHPSLKFKKLPPLMRGAGPVAVMRLLAGGEKYGYELVKLLESRSEGVLAMGQSTLYPLLYNLQAKGLVDARVDLAEGGRARKYYRLTDKGKRKLRRDQTQWEAPTLSSLRTQGERYLGRRDGVLVGIAVQRYRRTHASYPQSLETLVPSLLPAIPADRITGEPIRYRLIDGKPVVYSVGADRHDDGGQPPMKNGRPEPGTAAQWNVEVGRAAHGDWVLYPTPKCQESDEE